MDPVDATGPMRLVLCAFPDAASATLAVDGALARRLAACAQQWPVASTYWWKGEVESADEVVVLFKTAPKRVGALFRHLAQVHPYEVPEILEVDVARVHPPYLGYLARTIDETAPPFPLGGGHPAPPARRREGRRGRAARPPGRTRAPPRRR